MEDGPILPARLLLLADAFAIALGLFLVYDSVGVSGFGIMGFIVIPIFALLCSLGLWMWANGAGANLVSSPGWNRLDDQQKVRAVSVMGLHIAIGMAMVGCAMPFIMVPQWGLFMFLTLLLGGMAVTFSGLIRMFSWNRNSEWTFTRKAPLTVWMTVFLVLFAVVAVPVVVLDSYAVSGVDVEIGDSDMTIKAPMVDRTIAYTDISSVYLDDSFSIGHRVSGYGGLNMECGKYRNSEFGTYTLASYSSCDLFVVIKLKSGSPVVFNQENADDTTAVYNDLVSKL